MEYSVVIHHSYIMKIWKYVVILLLIVSAGSGVSIAQTKTSKKAAKLAAVKNSGETRHYTFNADYVLPLRGGARQLTSEYDLRGFERVPLEPGEKKTVHFTIHPDDLAILDKNMNWTVEPGKFQVMIGASSEDIKLKQEFEVVK